MIRRRKDEKLRRGLALLHELEHDKHRKLGRALYFLQCAINSEPKSTEALIGIAHVFFLQHRYEDECLALERAIEVMKEFETAGDAELREVTAELVKARMLAEAFGNISKPFVAPIRRQYASTETHARVVHLASVGRR